MEGINILAPGTQDPEPREPWTGPPAPSTRNPAPSRGRMMTLQSRPRNAGTGMRYPEPGTWNRSLRGRGQSPREVCRLGEIDLGEGGGRSIGRGSINWGGGSIAREVNRLIAVQLFGAGQFWVLGSGFWVPGSGFWGLESGSNNFATLKL